MRLMFPNKFVFQVSQHVWIDDNGVPSVTDNGGTLYPAGFFRNQESREAFGIVEVVEDPQPDPRYFDATADPENPGKWIATPKANLKDSLKAHAAAKRWEKEVGGITVGDMFIPTDERTRSVLTSAWASAKLDPGFFIPDWKVAPGVYVPLDNATIIAIAEAVRDHTRACFSLNKDVDALIDSGEITTFEAVDKAFNPPPM